jgi:hypothetical protein
MALMLAAGVGACSSAVGNATISGSHSGLDCAGQHDLGLAAVRALERCQQSWWAHPVQLGRLGEQGNRLYKKALKNES